MPSQCTCGGKFVHTFENRLLFRVKCNACGKTGQQRKRQKAKTK